MNPLRFASTLDSDAGGPIHIQFDVPELFGTKKPPVLVTVRGVQEHTYRSTAAVYAGRYFVSLNRGNAAAAAITAVNPSR